MTLGRNAVGYLTESMHGAGSPQAQRIQIQRGMDLEMKKKLAQHLAGIVPAPAASDGEPAAKPAAGPHRPSGFQSGPNPSATNVR
jgi:hypothetical protein